MNDLEKAEIKQNKAIRGYIIASLELWAPDIAGIKVKKKTTKKKTTKKSTKKSKSKKSKSKSPAKDSRNTSRGKKAARAAVK